MTGRELAKAWALAFSLVAVAVAFLTTAEWMFDRELLKGPIVAIGSSLTAHAIPARSPDSSGLLGDGRAHARFYKNLISEDETNSLVSKAVEAGASTVLVEVNTFAFDLAFTVGAGDDPWIIAASKALAGRADQLRSDFKWLWAIKPWIRCVNRRH